jgi:hypothetical protein
MAGGKDDRTDRRTWLKTGAAGGAATASVLALDGCAHVPPAGADDDPLAAIDAADVDRYLAGIDRRLAWIDESGGAPLFPTPSQPCAPEQQAEMDRFDRLFRKSARSLYITGCFLEAPEEIRAHPGMQARVASAQADMDEAVFGTTRLLETLTPEQHRRIGRTLKDKPEIAENLARYLDAPAREDGLPLKRRYLLRAGILDLAARMKAQSPALVIDKYVQKVRRIEARGPAAASADNARVLAARIGEEAFWAHQQRLIKLAGAWERKLAQVGPARPVAVAADAPPAQPPFAPPVADAPPAPPAPLPGAAEAPPPAAAAPPTAVPPPVRPAPPPVAPAPPLAPGPALAPGPTTGQKTLSAGGHVMGFGALSVGVGLIFAGVAHVTNLEVFAWPALVLGVTVGPILLVVGLLVVIVGAIIRAAE